MPTDPDLENQLRIDVLGDFGVFRDGEAVALPPSKKTRALLAFLVMSEKPVRRERLCELFWEIPDDPRASLRWSLSKIRGVVNSDGVERLKADRNFVQFDNKDVQVDALRFLQANVSDVTYIDAETLLDLETIVEPEGFIEDLALHNCPPFEAWRMSTANEIEGQQTLFLRNLISYYHEEPRRALHFASLLQQRFPDLEDLSDEIEELRARANQEVVKAPTGRADVSAPGASSEVTTRPRPNPMVPFRIASSQEQSVRYCMTRDRVRLAYCVDGEGPVVVRVGHWLTHLEYDLHSPAWHHWIAAFQSKATFVRYDVRGSGLSDWDIEDVSLEAQVADLESIMDVVGQRKVVLLGVSAAAPVAVAYAARHPERLSGLLIYGGFAKGFLKTSDVSVAQWENFPEMIRATWDDEDPMFKKIFTSLFAPTATIEQSNWLNEMHRVSMPGRNAANYLEAIGDFDVSEQARQITVPTLITNTSEDILASIEAAKRLANLIPTSELEVFEGKSHLLFEEDPVFEPFITAALKFIEARSTGVPWQARAEPAVAAHTRIEKHPDGGSELSQVTALAVDIIAPILTLQSDEPEAALELLDPIIDGICQSVEDHGGEIVSIENTFILAVFSARSGLESHPQQACRSALEISELVLKLSHKAARARIGLDHGDAIIRPRRKALGGGMEYSGAPLQTAGRISRALRRPLVAATSAVRSVVEGYVNVSELGAEAATSSVSSGLSNFSLTSNVRVTGSIIGWM